MTKKELAAVRRLTQYFNEYEERADKAFKRLQEMSREAGLPAWCSASGNLEQLIPVTKDSKALSAYNDYVECSAKYSLLLELGSGLANAQSKIFDMGPQTVNKN